MGLGKKLTANPRTKDADGKGTEYLARVMEFFVHDG